MKKFYISVLAVCVLFASTDTLSAQVVTSWTDSIVTYNFTTVDDSTRGGIQIFERFDSIWHYEYEWMGNWDVDSAKWIAYADYKRISDQADNQLLYTWRRWKDELGWEPYDSVWRDYDASSNILLMDVYKWNQNMQDWAGERRSEYFRDGAGSDTLKENSLWDWNTNQWRYNSKYINKFDQNQRLLESIYYEWSSFEEFWKFVGGERFEYTLNDAGTVATRLHSVSDFVDTVWHTSYKDEYTYNDAGLLLKDEGFRMAGEVWEQNRREDWAYDASGNDTLHTTYQYNYDTDSLEYSRREAYAYDEQGQQLWMERRIWDATLEDWLVFSRFAYTYHEDGLLASSNQENWSLPGDGAYYRTQNEFLYNDDGKDSVRIHYTWNEGLQDLDLQWKMFFYYGQTVEKDYTGIQNLPDAEFTLYPNPVRDLLMIEAEVPVGRMDLLDLNGRKVLSSARIEGGVDLSSLESGIYLLRLWDADGALMGTRKVLKE